MFECKTGRPAEGITDVEGRFTLTTFAQRDAHEVASTRLSFPNTSAPTVRQGKPQSLTRIQRLSAIFDSRRTSHGK